LKIQKRRGVKAEGKRILIEGQIKKGGGSAGFAAQERKENRNKRKLRCIASKRDVGGEYQLVGRREGGWSPAPAMAGSD